MVLTWFSISWIFLFLAFRFWIFGLLFGVLLCYLAVCDLLEVWYNTDFAFCVIAFLTLWLWYKCFGRCEYVVFGFWELVWVGADLPSFRFG